MEVWEEYQELAARHGRLKADLASRKDATDDEKRDAWHAEWTARTRHASWQQKREDFIWYTNGLCERCGTRPPPKDLQLHHIHYRTLWYENNSDLELLCPSCHAIADRERAQAAARRKRSEHSVERRALNYMYLANRFSGQKDWPVSYMEAVERIHQLDESELPT